MDTEDWRSFLKVSGHAAKQQNRQDATERAVRADAGSDVRVSYDFGVLMQEDEDAAQRRKDAEDITNRVQQQIGRASCRERV